MMYPANGGNKSGLHDHIIAFELLPKRFFDWAKSLIYLTVVLRSTPAVDCSIRRVFEAQSTSV